MVLPREFAAQLFQPPLSEQIARQEQVDDVPEYPQQQVAAAGGPSRLPHQLVGQLEPKRTVLRSEHAVMSQAQRLRQRRRITRQPGIIHQRENRGMPASTV